MSIDEVAQFDRDIAAWIEARALDRTAADISIEGIRHHSRSVNELARARMADPPAPAVETDVMLDGAGMSVPARVFRPAVHPPVPTIVYFHGGGWIAGGVDTHLQHARRLCVEVGAVVVSVDYRLAPEHLFPAAFDDCMAATRLACHNVAELGGDPHAVIVGGDSAGAQLAASVAIACRDESIDLAAQLLIVPVIDTRGGYRDREVNARYPSRAENDSDFGLTVAGMAQFVELYAHGIDDWRVSPVLAEDLAGTAPAVVHTAGFDVLRDEGAAYATMLREADVPVTHRHWATLNHGFLGLGGVAAAAARAGAQVSADLRAVLSGG